MKYVFMSMFIFVCVVAPVSVQACSCEMMILNRGMLERSTVFAGRVKHIKAIEAGYGDRIVFFDVTDVWSGEVEQRALVVNNAPCEYEFKVEQYYVVVARPGELYRFETGMCSGNKQVHAAEDVFEILGEPITRFDPGKSPWRRWNKERGLE
ncbi:MAG: hypothetical protein OER90_10915 [Gemmatimonadota bacterium]|nr:hypothetical protein [Gemmatimonadota bacterium]